MKSLFIFLNLAFVGFNLFVPAQALALPDGADTYIIYGDGDATQGGNMKWRAMQAGANQDITDNTSIGAVYYNEGHPENNHRDGYGVVGWYKEHIADGVTAEVGAGPYFAMDTTNINGEQYNEKQLGALAALAVLYRVYGNVSLKAQFTRTQVPGSFNTDTIMVGVNVTLGNPQRPSDIDYSHSENHEVSVWGGSSHTTQSTATITEGYEVEDRVQVSDHIAYSISALDEGDTGIIRREGVVGQVWYVSPTTNNWRVDVGAGPYAAREESDGQTHNKLMGVVTFRLSKGITKKVRVGLSFQRVVSNNNRDQDMFMVGIQKKY